MNFTELSLMQNSCRGVTRERQFINPTYMELVGSSHGTLRSHEYSPSSFGLLFRTPFVSTAGARKVFWTRSSLLFLSLLHIFSYLSHSGHIGAKWSMMSVPSDWSGCNAKLTVSCFSIPVMHQKAFYFSIAFCVFPGYLSLQGRSCRKDGVLRLLFYKLSLFCNVLFSPQGMANCITAGVYGRIAPMSLCLLRKHQCTYRKNIVGLSAQQTSRENHKHPKEAVVWDQCLLKGWWGGEIRMVWIRSEAGLQAASFVSGGCWVALEVDCDETDGFGQENGPYSPPTPLEQGWSPSPWRFQLILQLVSAGSGFA